MRRRLKRRPARIWPDHNRRDVSLAGACALRQPDPVLVEGACSPSIYVNFPELGLDELLRTPSSAKLLRIYLLVLLR